METKTSAILKKHAYLLAMPVFVLIKVIAFSILISACDTNSPDSIHHSKSSDDSIYTSSGDSSFIDSLQVLKHEYISDESALKIRIEYPEIKGLKDTALQSKINARLVEVFMGAVKAEDDDLEGEGEIKTVYTVQYNSKGILSIIYNTWEFYSEASHDWTNYFSLTINLKTGKDILPEDLFIGNYKEKIFSMLQAKEDSLNKSGTLFTAENKEDFPVFCITKNSFAFYLKGSSQAEGTQEFKILFDALKENIHPSFYGVFF